MIISSEPINKQESAHEIEQSTGTDKISARLLSLDFLRGLIMVILVLGETGIFQRLNTAFNNPFTKFLSTQFEHSEWRGLHMWDVILPAFMLIAGTSMAYSYKRQKNQLHYSWSKSFKKILKRCFWLMFWGVLMYSVNDDNTLNLEFSNVLAQLAFTTLFTFLVINWKVEWQLLASALFLLLPDLLFRLIRIPGFDEPFIKNHNFGAYIDMLVLNNVNGGHNTNSINFITSTAHTIWGLMAGQLLLSTNSCSWKFKRIILFGLFILILGFVLDYTGITPMLKWISTSSFVLATGGISLITLAICYKWIDVLRHQGGLKPFTVVGMNSIFIYLFYNFVGDRWLNEFTSTLISGVLKMVNIPVEVGGVISSLIIFAFEWYLCYFLYKKKLFFKL